MVLVSTCQEGTCAKGYILKSYNHNFMISEFVLINSQILNQFRNHKTNQYTFENESLNILNISNVLEERLLESFCDGSENCF